MSETKTVQVNGVHYDEITGLPVASDTNAEVAVQNELRRVQSVHAKGLHKTLDRSKALNRQFVKKSPMNVSRPTSATMDVKRPAQARSPHITKFAGDIRPVRSAHTSRDIAPVVHP